MTMRKPNLADRIRDIETEMETRQIFLQAAVDEIEELSEKEKAGLFTQNDYVRACELKVIVENHKKWIDDNKKTLTAFYRPASA